MSRKRTPNPYTINENVVTMVTHKGIAFTFDLEDLEKVKRYIWCENNGRIVANNKNKSLYLLSRFLMNPPKSLVVDHIDGNPLNNCKSNLRICTQVQNTYNSKHRPNPLGIIGVSKKNKSEYIAYITFNKKHINLGTFNCLEKAVKARKEAEQKYFGEYSFDNSRKK
jgi:hypothetical protein